MPDMLFILGLALLLFGPKKIPEIARQIGRFKNAADGFKAQIQSELQNLETEVQNLAPAEVKEVKEALQPITALRTEAEALITGKENVPEEKVQTSAPK